MIIKGSTAGRLGSFVPCRAARAPADVCSGPRNLTIVSDMWLSFNHFALVSLAMLNHRSSKSAYKRPVTYAEMTFWVAMSQIMSNWARTECNA